MFGATGGRRALQGASILACLLALGCAARGRIATADEVARLKHSSGLSAAGKLTLRGPQGQFGTRVIFGVRRPDRVRIEIPSGSGLRFLLVATDGKLRADLPGEDAMFEGAATREVMNGLFGVDIEPREFVARLLGEGENGAQAVWRFERGNPREIVMQGGSSRSLKMTLDAPELDAPADAAFVFGPPRGTRLSLSEMSQRLGLRR